MVDETAIDSVQPLVEDGRRFEGDAAEQDDATSTERLFQFYVTFCAVNPVRDDNERTLMK